MILIDAHVHIYNCFDLQTFLDSALKNFKVQAIRCKQNDTFTPILFLTETKGENWFQHLEGYAREGRVIGSTSSKNWSFYHTDENCSLQLRCNGGQGLFIIAGHQIVTTEGLEILALATDKNFNEGTPIEQIIQSIRDTGGIPVIPYGFGKWIGRRGMILKNLLKKTEDSRLFLGDNGGRPLFLPRPSHFMQAEKKGIRVLPGSDPLPFPSECERAGSFGFSVKGSISSTHPARDITRILLDSTCIFKPYGHLAHLPHFFRNQLLMQILKRRQKH